MHIRFARAALTLPLLIACGGRFVDDTTGASAVADASSAASDAPATGADVTPPPAAEAGPAPTWSCDNDVLDVQQSGQACTTSEKWSCGSDEYGFSCLCPQSTCECWHNGVPVKLVGQLVQCPGCIEANDAFAICGFPR